MSWVKNKILTIVLKLTILSETEKRLLNKTFIAGNILLINLSMNLSI